MEILVMDADDPARAFQEMGRSQERFDVWFRQFLMEIYGLDLSQPPTGPPPEKVLDWSTLVEQHAEPGTGVRVVDLR
jgi:hypothetical protein